MEQGNLPAQPQSCKESNNSSSQWKELKPKTNDQVPQGKGFIKGFISDNHLIALTNSKDRYDPQEVYTFHLKDHYWSCHKINGPPKTLMTSKSCIAQPGLIVDITEQSYAWTLRLLTFENDEGSFLFPLYERFRTQKFLPSNQRCKEFYARPA